jgi:hypothetical protein
MPRPVHRRRPADRLRAFTSTHEGHEIPALGAGTALVPGGLHDVADPWPSGVRGALRGVRRRDDAAALRLRRRRIVPVLGVDVGGQLGGPHAGQWGEGLGTRFERRVVGRRVVERRIVVQRRQLLGRRHVVERRLLERGDRGTVPARRRVPRRHLQLEDGPMHSARAKRNAVHTRRRVCVEPVQLEARDLPGQGIGGHTVPARRGVRVGRLQLAARDLPVGQNE